MRCVIFAPESIRNFRDAGGLKTAAGTAIRPGLLYRSGDLADASTEDLHGLSQLGIRTIVDLRAVGEARRHPDRLPNNGIQHHHIPIQVSSHDDRGPFKEMLSHLFGSSKNINYHEMMVESYREYVSHFQASFSRVVRLALDRTNLPMLVHCTAGKDRTGFSVSLIQHALGVSREDVLENYLLSNRATEALKQTMRDRFKATSFLGISYEHFSPLMEARAEYLEAAYEQINNMYNSIDQFLEQGLAITRKDLSALGSVFLEEG